MALVVANGVCVVSTSVSWGTLGPCNMLQRKAPDLRLACFEQIDEIAQSAAQSRAGHWCVACIQGCSAESSAIARGRVSDTYRLFFTEPSFLNTCEGATACKSSTKWLKRTGQRQVMSHEATVSHKSVAV